MLPGASHDTQVPSWSWGLLRKGRRAYSGAERLAVPDGRSKGAFSQIMLFARLAQLLQLLPSRRICRRRAGRQPLHHLPCMPCACEQPVKLVDPCFAGCEPVLLTLGQALGSLQPWIWETYSLKGMHILSI